MPRGLAGPNSSLDGIKLGFPPNRPWDKTLGASRLFGGWFQKGWWVNGEMREGREGSQSKVHYENVTTVGSGTQSHCRHLGDYVQLPSPGLKKLGSVPTNSCLSVVEGTSYSINFWTLLVCSLPELWRLTAWLRQTPACTKVRARGQGYGCPLTVFVPLCMSPKGYC